jgi:hypothetical protein
MHKRNINRTIRMKSMYIILDLLIIPKKKQGKRPIFRKRS